MTRVLLGIDVGGSSVKAGLVDVTSGQLCGDLVSEPTPQPSTPERLMPTLATLAARLRADAASPLGVCFPSVVKRGTIRTAANVDDSWVGVNGAELVERTLSRSTCFLNDADAAGIAEMGFGAGRGVKGPVVMLTFGTGVGSALFSDGQLFPNTELGHLEMRGMDAEKWASAHVRTVLHLDWPDWIERVNEYLARMHALLWPDLFILGGAVSEHFAEFAPLLRCAAEVRPARFTNQAGVIGAALAAAYMAQAQ